MLRYLPALSEIIKLAYNIERIGQPPLIVQSLYLMDNTGFHECTVRDNDLTFLIYRTTQLYTEKRQPAYSAGCAILFVPLGRKGEARG